MGRALKAIAIGTAIFLGTQFATIALAKPAPLAAIVLTIAVAGAAWWAGKKQIAGLSTGRRVTIISAALFALFGTIAGPYGEQNKQSQTTASPQQAAAAAPDQSRAQSLATEPSPQAVAAAPQNAEVAAASTPAPRVYKLEDLDLHRSNRRWKDIILTAKNSFNLEITLRITCHFEGSTMTDVSIAEDF
ncbi:hypothetical protein [Zavarzinia sp. CC-PAN008]|uniref:hypothetical protein n=1 Tax=Zavarzinia sp. CC-PAN008 TaxID=3243332 RepID=UPI003F746BF0